ncbi:MAG: TadE/TadG family type IV pilus assembly protein [Pseudomonadota bacterium]
MRARLHAHARPGDEAGLASVELALLLPVVGMIFLLLGHMGEVLMAEARVQRAARNLAATAALMETISDTQMADLLAGAAAVIAPAEGEVSMTLTSVKAGAEGFAVRWSDGAAAYAPGETMALADAAATAYGALAATNILVSEARLAYASRFARVWDSLPFVTQALSLTTTLTARAHALPATVSGSPPAIVATTRLTAAGAVQ